MWFWFIRITVGDEKPRGDPQERFVHGAWKLVAVVFGFLIVTGILDLLGLIP